MKDTPVDREYKNNVFCDLFSEKSNALSLYNALNHTNYQNTDELEIVTLSDMPLRGLVYFAHNIDGILKSR